MSLLAAEQLFILYCTNEVAGILPYIATVYQWGLKLRVISLVRVGFYFIAGDSWTGGISCTVPSKNTPQSSKSCRTFPSKPPVRSPFPSPVNLRSSSGICFEDQPKRSDAAAGQQSEWCLSHYGVPPSFCISILQMSAWLGVCVLGSLS